jgi:hypothetical protein
MQSNLILLIGTQFNLVSTDFINAQGVQLEENLLLVAAFLVR